MPAVYHFTWHLVEARVSWTRKQTSCWFPETPISANEPFEPGGNAK